MHFHGSTSFHSSTSFRFRHDTILHTYQHDMLHRGHSLCAQRAHNSSRIGTLQLEGTGYSRAWFDSAACFLSSVHLFMSCLLTLSCVLILFVTFCTAKAGLGRNTRRLLWPSCFSKLFLQDHVITIERILRSLAISCRRCERHIQEVVSELIRPPAQARDPRTLYAPLPRDADRARGSRSSFRI